MSEVDKPFEIPEHWKWKTFEEIGEWTGGGTPSKRKTSYWEGDIPWVSPKDMKRLEIDDTEDHVTETAIAESATKRVPSDSILFVTRSGILAHTLPTALTTVPVTINQDLKALVLTEEIEPQFLLYYTRAVERSILSQCSKHGTTVASLESGRLYRFPVPLPPLPEQRRIVAKIEELFSNLDAGMGELSVAEQQLERYRLSVLQAAVEGRLTADWRRTHTPEPADQLLERIQAKKTELYNAKKIRKPKEAEPITKEHIPSELPSKWEWARLTAVVQRAVDCLHKTAPFEDIDTGYYCVDTTCMSKSEIEYDKLRPVSKKTYQEWTRRMIPEPGDVLFSREGTVGLTAVIPEGINLCLGQRIMIFRLPNQVDPRYFHKALLSPTIGRQWKQKLMGTTASRVNIGDIRQFLVPLPPLAEQKQIVAEVERLLSVADDASATTKQEQTRAERLRQSILKQAFSGKLVPHEAQHSAPVDSPTSVVREGAQIEMGL